MLRCIEAGHKVNIKTQPTIADGSTGNVELGAITDPICRDLLDECVTVNEAETMTAMCDCIEHGQQLLEWAAGVALAAQAKTSAKYRGQSVAIVICGARIGLTDLLRVLEVH
jgi:threonine dehydratase